MQLLHGALELLVRRKPRRRLRVNEQLAAGCKSERPGRFKPYTAVSGAAEAAERPGLLLLPFLEQRVELVELGKQIRRLLFRRPLTPIWAKLATSETLNLRPI